MKGYRWVGLGVCLFVIVSGCKETGENPGINEDLAPDDALAEVDWGESDQHEIELPPSCEPACGANQQCQDGRCVCLSGWGDCDDDGATGCETSLMHAEEHCGGCGSLCAGSNNACINGECRCASGWGECDGDLANGCETSLLEDADHCGGCGLACGPNAVGCESGICQCAEGYYLPGPNTICTDVHNGPTQCREGFALCDFHATTGCETHIASDPENCGACTYTCGVHALCKAGECVCEEGFGFHGANTQCSKDTFICRDGFGDCDTDSANGCEGDLMYDPRHCGACGHRCDEGQVCFMGECEGQWSEIPDGSFLMGSPLDEAGRDVFDAGETQRAVSLTRSFAMQSTEVTWGQWVALMGGRIPSGWTRRMPYEEASWYDALRFANALSVQEGLTPCYVIGDCEDDACAVTLAHDAATPYECEGYRLPTEAEWEYAARAGTTTALYTGNLIRRTMWSCLDEQPTLDEAGWYCGNTSFTKEVGLKTPNSWGLFDVMGNAAEWVWDWMDKETVPQASVDPVGPASGDWKVTRGGVSYSNALYCRSAARRSATRAGFRLVRTLPD